MKKGQVTKSHDEDVSEAEMADPGVALNLQGQHWGGGRIQKGPQEEVGGTPLAGGSSKGPSSGPTEQAERRNDGRN